MTTALQSAPPVQDPVLQFLVDDEEQLTTQKVLTPRQIMENAKPRRIDPARHYLVQIKGQRQMSYQGKVDEEIPVREGLTFVSISTGPTPVS
jgi:hypothetical protein